MTRMLENIERHLERVRTIADAGIPDAGVGPDHPHHQASLIALFEAAETNNVAIDALSVNLGDWLDRYLEPLVDELHWGLLAGFGGQFDAHARRQFIDWTIARKSGLADFSKHPAPSLTMQSWLEHAVARDLATPPAWQPWQLASRYCGRLGLVSSPPEPPRLRMPGQTWLRLRGLDRLRWLLALEAVQAVGDDDPWCASTAQFAGILRNIGRFFDDDEDRSGVPQWSGVQRWISLGVLVGSWDDEFGACYRLSKSGEQLLGRQEPDILELFENLARAQAHDDRSEALGAADPSPRDSELAATTMRHARLVAHEVRNALLPVRHALDKVWRAIEPTETGAALRGPRDQIEQGITRLYEFVEVSARMSESISESGPATFVVIEAIEQARLSLPELSGVRLAAIPGTANPRCRGHRGRFVLVLLNLMRNAIQVAGPGVSLTISVDASKADTTTILIDDDGPGIPEHLRDRLFEPGISNRAEGTGHGLALVREVVERELGGTIVCEGAPSGGARFRLGLPSTAWRPQEQHG
jgi:signal transduction histidine kinase